MLTRRTFVKAALATTMAAAIGATGCSQPDKREQFIKWLQDNGPYKSGSPNPQATALTYAIEGRSDGDIRCACTSDQSKTGVAMQTSFVLTLHKGKSIADVTSQHDSKVLTATISESGEGTIDLATYTKGTNVSWDKITSNGKALDGSSINTSSLTKDASNQLNDMVTVLTKCLTASNTGATLKDLGFEKLS